MPGTKWQQHLNGTITTVAGNWDISFGHVGGFSGNRADATLAELNGPICVWVDRNDVIYFADDGNHRIRRVENGMITTIAGNGSSGFSGDGGDATLAELHNPRGVMLDAAATSIFPTTAIYEFAGGILTELFVLLAEPEL